MNISRPLVTIYISTHNRLEKLKRAINSVLQQDYDNWELIVCDDASCDGTSDYMNDICIKDTRIRYLRNDVNKGACETRNLGIFNAKGTFITGLDDDDEFTNDRISFFVDNWNVKYSFLCCNFKDRYIDNNDLIHYKCNSKDFVVLSYKDLLFDNTASNQIFTLTTRLQEIGGFDKRVKRLQDWDTWLRLSFKFGDFIRFNKATYIMHHDHLSGELRVSQNEKITKSLLDLVLRNKKIYSDDDFLFMNFIIDQKNNNASLYDSIYWTYKKKNPKHFLKYMVKVFR
ncbi:glycosyltransferase [Raoultella ornithinolytica]|uniref:glycosyltransferase n=1 Tax=Raoultella ornithinolytica TaxID=54291 RepID=UPI0022845339|nr:glycosyltransferase [Raoultella ornithinolytica]MCZ0102997.1 glycosyltransferase [Raoultella ornithinolytica]